MQLDEHVMKKAVVQQLNLSECFLIVKFRGELTNSIKVMRVELWVSSLNSLCYWCDSLTGSLSSLEMQFRVFSYGMQTAAELRNKI